MMKKGKKQSIINARLKTWTNCSTIKTNIKVNPTFVIVVFIVFLKEDLLIKHNEDCYGINKNSTRREMPTDGESHISFKNHQNQMPVQYVIYADFESIIKPKSTQAGEKSEITSTHETCWFRYQVVRYDGQAEEPVIYRGEDVV